MVRDDRKSILVAYMIAIEITGLLFSGCVATPQFDSQPSFVQFYENTSTPIGTLLFNLTATDSTNPSNRMNIFATGEESSMYVNVTQRGIANRVIADVFLKKLLDRESNEGGIDLKFSLTDTSGNVILKLVKLYILDVCDEPPQYDRPSYTLEINEENITSENIVFSEIHATDRDNGNDAVVTYSMEELTSSFTSLKHMNKKEIGGDISLAYL
ncbi:hypothetical protein CHS0354_020601 [Potamilus streckersoni]|nr:hypothetical protein CHS0354_020601 [Potamilus streckersoni]